MNKARNIWRDKLRLLRSPILAKLDIDFLRAIETNNLEKQEEIKQNKQILRDAPNDPRINSAETIDELLSINPIESLQI
jgi:hypothetical protein